MKIVSTVDEPRVKRLFDIAELIVSFQIFNDINEMVNLPLLYWEQSSVCSC